MFTNRTEDEYLSDIRSMYDNVKRKGVPPAAKGELTWKADEQYFYFINSLETYLWNMYVGNYEFAYNALANVITDDDFYTSDFTCYMMIKDVLDETLKEDPDE